MRPVGLGDRLHRAVGDQLAVGHRHAAPHAHRVGPGVRVVGLDHRGPGGQAAARGGLHASAHVHQPVGPVLGGREQALGLDVGQGGGAAAVGDGDGAHVDAAAQDAVGGAPGEDRAGPEAVAAEVDGLAVEGAVGVGVDRAVGHTHAVARPPRRPAGRPAGTAAGRGAASGPGRRSAPCGPCPRRAPCAGRRRGRRPGRAIPGTRAGPSAPRAARASAVAGAASGACPGARAACADG